MPKRKMEPEPEPEPVDVSVEAPEQEGIAALFQGFPCELVSNPQMGGSRDVVASRHLEQGERVLASAPLGIAIDRRHMATRCSWCFAMREAPFDESHENSSEEEIEWEVRCERCCSAYYCTAACAEAAAPQHELCCAALCAVEKKKALKKEERLLARLLISVLGSLRFPAGAAAAARAAQQPSLPMLLELWPDQRESAGSAKRAKQRTVAAKTVLAIAGDALLSALPGDLPSRERLLVAALERGPMNEFGLWCADGEAGSAGTAYYPAGAMCNHSCLPNMVHQFEGTDLVFYTVREVKAGESLCFSYTPPGGAVATKQAVRFTPFLNCFIMCLC